MTMPKAVCHLIPAVLLAVSVLSLAGCGGGGGAAVITALQIYPSAFTARVGDLISYNAVATYSNGTQANITSKVTWASSNSAAATITAAGKLTAAAVGNTQITATSGTVTSNAVTVTVVAVPVLPTATYFPLGHDYYWTYTGTEVTPHGVRTTATTVTLTQSVPRQVAISGETWWEVQVKGTDPLETPTWLYMRHDPEGLVRLEEEGHPPANMLAASLSAGASWTHPEDPTTTFEIDSVTESVTVPAGTYENCVKVVQTNGSASPATQVIVWYAKDTGIVWEQVYSGGTLESEQQLVSFTAGAP